jgi:hypothetical protein
MNNKNNKVVTVSHHKNNNKVPIKKNNKNLNKVNASNNGMVEQNHRNEPVLNKRSSPRLQKKKILCYKETEKKERSFFDYDMANVNKDQFMKTITFDFFEDNAEVSWDWSQYCTVRQDPKLPTTVIGKSYFPIDGNWDDSFAIQEIKRLRLKDRSANAIEKMTTDIKYHLTKCRNTIRNWFHQFFIDFSNIEGFKYIEVDGVERKIKTKEELDHVVDNFTTKEQVFGFLYIMYFTFDYMPRYAFHIMKYVMLQHSLSYDEVDFQNEVKAVSKSRKTGNRKRMTKCCVEKLVSVMLNDVRKSYRLKIEKNYGVGFKFKRDNISELTDYEKRTYNRKPKTLHGWMIKGEFVSIFYNFILV